MRVSAIYPTYSGEVNIHGIGAPVIFLRLQGCHLRCYKLTLGTLCDTPEALSRHEDAGGKEYSIPMILASVRSIREETGINLICLSGGDPLWQDKDALLELFNALVSVEFIVSVETSGTISVAPYLGIPNVYWVLDYKLSSAGVKQSFIWQDVRKLSVKDWVKFVVYEESDFYEARRVMEELILNSDARIAVGPYWNGKVSVAMVQAWLQESGFFGTRRVQLNVQLHKMATLYDSCLSQGTLKEVVIPQKI